MPDLPLWHVVGPPPVCRIAGIARHLGDHFAASENAARFLALVGTLALDDPDDPDNPTVSILTSPSLAAIIGQPFPAAAAALEADDPTALILALIFE